ncbi:hypothetical protein SCLCIDRAFT_33935 [Scleroderma citrinum Foug A]|uniref:Uncharacterized protein n=1 Tax=Scleroderma citrinum Foug A TaxID=1036808 RepID=A0A0C2YM61_9AGAM|nr:hypothetical protein SCLCIDRAFT_33935 [Scleroderma citrinum Foug A]
MHQAWYASAHCKQNGESTNDYYACQSKHYEAHREEEDYPQLWEEIHKYWTKNITGTKDMSSKVQTWCNVKGIHIFGCVIYSGNDEAVRQAQGIFAGSTLCMELASERQTDVAKLLDYLTMVVKYKVLNPAAPVQLPDFTVLSQPLYNRALALRPQESRQDRSWCVLPMVTMYKFYKSDIMHTQKNIPWKSVLNLLYEHQYVIIDWPAGVDAVGPSFNVKSLTADELCALTVPFLKEQMGADYFAEGLGDDNKGTGQVVPTPKSLFYLQHWTTEQAQLFCRADPEMFNIPLIINMDNCSLCILSDSQKFLNGVPKHMLPKPQKGASSTLSLPPSSPPVGEESPVQGHVPMNVAAIRHAHHPSLAASRHSSPPSSPTAEPLQPSAQRRGSVNMAAICSESK